MDFNKGDGRGWKGGEKGRRMETMKLEEKSEERLTQTSELFCIHGFSPTVLIMALQLLICRLSDYCKAQTARGGRGTGTVGR